MDVTGPGYRIFGEQRYDALPPRVVPRPRPPLSLIEIACDMLAVAPPVTPPK